MKDLTYLDEYRIEMIPGDPGDEHNGAFQMKIRGEKFLIIASNGGGWEHVSISHKYKVPGWRVMCELKEMFFEDTEAVYQIHPPKAEYMNVHKNCLHLWRPTKEGQPLPPVYMIGPPEFKGGERS